jgi:LmbE family N-acetylglucosaminyl deacetylase
MKKNKFIFLFILLVSCIHAQHFSNENSSLIFHRIKKLNTVGSVLYIAAHPDDENTRLLAYLANEKKLRTAYLSITRGDGGQNLIGKEQGEALGLIRTNELLAARSIDGAEQFFTRSNDFGYSKNPEETFAIWNKDSLLYDVVLTIRKFKPDIIICRFPTTGEGGHGHHTASAIIAEQAFEAAADSTVFPDQLKSYGVWKTKSLFWNTFNFGTTNTTAPDQLQVDVGVFNVLLGKSYGEIASESRSMHKSQGFGSARQRGSNIEYFKQLKGDTIKNNLFQHLNSSWSRFQKTDQLQQLINDCLRKFNIDNPSESINDLITIHQQLKAIDNNHSLFKHWKIIKLKEIEDLILSCSGIWLEANSNNFSGVPGEDISLSIQAIARNPVSAVLKSVSFFNGTDSLFNMNLVPNKFYTFKYQKKLPELFHYSNPYWLNQSPLQGMYHVSNNSLIGTPLNNAQTKIKFDLIINGFQLSTNKILTYKSTDPVKGEVYRPFEILPAVTLNFSEKVIVFPDLQSKTVKLIVKSQTKNCKGILHLKTSSACKIILKDSIINLSEKADEQIIEALIVPDKNFSSGTIEASIQLLNQTVDYSIQRIEYDHIPYQFILSKAQSKLVVAPLKKSGNKIGYISGAGDDIPICLAQLGYQVTVLNDEQLVKENLNFYDAIVTGVRAYNTIDRLQVHHPKLMNYIKNGGNLIVQYNTNNRIGPVLAKIGPYPFTISRDRVTDEHAPVTFVKSSHPILNIPNKITEDDFKDWIQERGIYFVSDRDANYDSVITMNDPGEKASDGSIIVAKYGKGNFVYTGLSFFRQLPAGVPGAFRLFVNMISLPKNK